MEAKILSTIKTLKICANFFGFLPFCMNKNDKNYKKFLIFSYIYSTIVITIMIFLIYNISFYILDDYEKVSLMPKMIQHAFEVLYISVSILQNGGIFIHSGTMSDIFESFCDIDNKVNSNFSNIFDYFLNEIYFRFIQYRVQFRLTIHRIVFLFDQHFSLELVLFFCHAFFRQLFRKYFHQNLKQMKKDSS